jgi:hypothetical protein
VERGNKGRCAIDQRASIGGDKSPLDATRKLFSVFLSLEAQDSKEDNTK